MAECLLIAAPPCAVLRGLATERARRAVIALGRTRLRNAARGFVRACRPDVARADGPRRNLWVARRKGWLAEPELEEFNRLLMRLVLLLRHDAGTAAERRKCHEFSFALAPIVPQPRGAGRRMG
jgi:hypothetical protein